MGGITRRFLMVFGVAMLALLLTPAAVAVAQSEQYPPSPSVEPASAVRAGGIDDPAKSSLAFTGSSDTVPMIWIAAGLVVFGGALVFVARQRRSASNRT